MQDFFKTSKDIISSPQGNKLKGLMNTPEAQKLNQIVDAKAVETAAAKGDMQTLSAVLAQVMKTEEGQNLAKQISKTMENKK